MKAIRPDDSAGSELVSAGLARDLRRNGSVIMSIFAFVWALAVPRLESTTAQWIVFVVALALTVVTIVLAIRNARPPSRSRMMPTDWQRRYNLVGLLEAVAIGVAVFGLIWLDAPELIPAVVCLIVGVHFVPLARIFDQGLYRWTAIGLCVIAVVGAVLLVESSAEASRAVVGLGAAAALWVTSALETLRG